MNTILTSYVSAFITIVIVDNFSKKGKSNLFDWMMWFSAPVLISIFITIVIKILVWVNPELSNSGSEKIYFVIMTSIALGCTMVWPEKPFDLKKEESRQKIKLNELFEKYHPILPDPYIEKNDRTIIETTIKKTLIDFDFGKGDMISQRDSEHFDVISNFFPIGWSKFKTQIKVNSKLYRYLHFLSESTKIKFITYSPDYNYFIAYIHFELSEGHTKGTKTCKIVLGKKTNKEILLYDFTQGLEDWLRRTDESYYRFLTGWREREAFINNFTRHTLTRDFKYPHYNIMEKEFWKDPNLFSSIEFKGESIMRYETTNIMYHNDKDKIEEYQLRKCFTISKYETLKVSN